MKTIKQGGLYRYYKNDQDWAVVMAHKDWGKEFSGQVLACSENTSLEISVLMPAKKGSYCAIWNKKHFTFLPDCDVSFVCKPKNPKKEKELVVEGEYYFETTKGKKI